MHIPEWFTADAGSGNWWQQQIQQGIPRIERLNAERCRITFLWRAPHNSATPIEAVWLNITGVTDHHQADPPTTLIPLPATDLWYYQLELPSDWRGSYCFIADQQPANVPPSDDLWQRRDWWRVRFPFAEPDRLNPLQSWASGRGMRVSPLHLPDAPAQPAWQALDQGTSQQLPLNTLIWQSQRLANQRRVWIYTTGQAADSSRPLAILLDGQFWANTMPIAGPLQKLTDNHQLPPAIYVMPEIIDREHRSRELPCNADFWLAVRDELLPLLAEQFNWQVNPRQTLVAGQSFGGLSAVYATLNWPESFPKALSLSGSFWWPDRNAASGYLPTHLRQHPPAPATRHIVLQAGRREKTICDANQAMHKLLNHYQIRHSLTLIEGGHDALWWRGSLLSGLQTLWQDLVHDIE